MSDMLDPEALLLPDYLSYNQEPRGGLPLPPSGSPLRAAFEEKQNRLLGKEPDLPPTQEQLHQLLSKFRPYTH